MKQHDAFLELAAAAVDFPLSAAERGRLDQHLAGCPTCQREAAAFHADARSLAALPPVRLSDRRADELLAGILRPPSDVAWRSLRLLAVAALLAVLAIGSLLVGAELLRRANDDDLSVVPVPSASPGPDASPAPDDVVGTSWVRTEVPETARTQPGGASMSGVIAGGPGAIAWGFVYGEGPRIWTSVDGTTWEPATVEAPTDPDPVAFEPGSVSAVTAWGSGYVAVGGYHRLDTGRRGLVWTSQDGRDWSLQPFDPDFEHSLVYEVIAWRGELLAFGIQSAAAGGGGVPSLLWSSRDGATWQAEQLTLPGDLTLDLAAWSNDRLWATAGHQGDDTGSEGWTILTSTDGRSWSPSPLAPYPGGLHAVDGGLVSLVQPRLDAPPTSGSGEPVTPGIHRSADLETWQLLADDPAAVGRDLIAVGSTLIMVGDDAAGDPECRAGCQAMGWRSVDGGATWQAVPADVVGGTMGHVAALPDGTLVSVGVAIDDGGTPSPAAWTSPPVRAAPAGSGWVDAGRLVGQHGRAAVVAAADGTVVVVGDDNTCTTGSAWPTSVGAEIRDEAGTWAAAEALPSPRDRFAAVALADGRVLVTGGLNADAQAGAPQSFSSSYLLETTTGAWSRTGSLQSARADPAFTKLGDGRVLVTGGYYMDQPNQLTVRVLGSTELYDPATGTWTFSGSLIQARAGARAVTLADGRVLVVGGWSDTYSYPKYGTAPLASAEVLDPATGTWTAAGSLAVPRAGFALVALADGGALVAGGLVEGDARAPTALAERFDPRAGTWSAAADMPTAAFVRAAARLADGRVLVAGGETTSFIPDADVPPPAYTDAAETYDPDTDAWSPIEPLPAPRADAKAVLLDDGSVLLATGFGTAEGETPGCPVPDATVWRYLPG